MKIFQEQLLPRKSQTSPTLTNMLVGTLRTHLFQRLTLPEKENTDLTDSTGFHGFVENYP
jgi:hypothetical protein